MPREEIHMSVDFESFAAGLAPLNAPEGTLALYSAAPDRVIRDRSGDNSLFAGELIKELRSSDRTVEQVFNRTRVGVSRASKNEQVPWVTSSLLEELYFSSSRGMIVGPAPVAEPAPAKPVPAPIHPAAPTTASRREPVRIAKPGDVFRDCPDCAEMVVIPAGSFEMGSNSDYEGPVHRVSIARPFAIGRFEVTFDEWDNCVNAGGCTYRGRDQGWGRGNRPVIDVSWLDAKAFATWLSRKTGQSYRLPTEAEWEYAARGGTKSAFWWGNTAGSGRANCDDCGTDAAKRTSPVGSYKPNPFGLYDTAGNAAEWVEDCWNNDYQRRAARWLGLGHRTMPIAGVARWLIRRSIDLSALDITLPI